MGRTMVKLGAAALLSVLGVAAGCVGGSKPGATGSVSIPLATTTANGRVFALCSGLFRISAMADSGGMWTIQASEHIKEGWVAQALPTGRYRLELSSWQLCENNSAGLTPVGARLESANPMYFDIVALETAYVTFAFVAAERPVAFGGQVVVNLQVREADGASGPYGGAPDLYDGCIFTCARERETARHADEDGASVSCSRWSAAASCTTYCYYETCRNSSDSRCAARLNPRWTSACPALLDAYYRCASRGIWTCEKTDSGTYVPRPPQECPSAGGCE